MKLTIIIVLLSLCIHPVLGQAFKTPNYSEIEKNIKKEGTNLYYPTLLQRFTSGDSTFTTEELQHLYYGFQFQNNYSSFDLGGLSDSLSKIFNKEEELTADDYNTVIRICEKYVQTYPFNCRYYFYLSYAYKQLGNQKEKVNITSNKIKNFFHAIESSGSGLTFEDRLYVIQVSHEYDYLQLLGLNSISQSLIETTDYLKLEKNELDIEGLYFDVSASFNHMEKMLSEKSKTAPKNNTKKK